MSVIFSNYADTNGNNVKGIDTPFNIGDFVVPCKDNIGTPYIKKEYEQYKGDEDVVINIKTKTSNIGELLYYYETTFTIYKDTSDTFLYIEPINPIKSFSYEILDEGFSKNTVEIKIKILADYISTIDLRYELEREGTKETTISLTALTQNYYYKTEIIKIKKPENCYNKTINNVNFLIPTDVYFYIPSSYGTVEDEFDFILYSTKSNYDIFLNLPIYYKKVYVKAYFAPIYKVVDVEIEDNGGAGIQHLKLMEVPKQKLYGEI